MRIKYAPKAVNMNVKVFSYDIETEKLIALDTAEKVYARSGPFGKGPIPKGQYMVKPAVAIDAGDDANKGFIDESGFAWWAALVPTFQTDRTGLGIHPDGNVEGTLGCIGLVLEDTRAWFEMFDEPAILMVV